MTTSGTTTFSLTRDDIINYALRKIGRLDLGSTPDATIVANTATALDMMIKSWITRGIKLWTINEITLPLVASQTKYVVGPTGTDLVTDKPMKLKQAWLRDVSVTPNTDIPLNPVSQYDYNLLGSKFSSGTPNSIYLEVGRDNSNIYLYLTPDTFTGTNYQLHFVTQRLIQDVGVSTNNLDFPTEWLYTLGWNLAAEIALDNGVDAQKIAYIETKAAKLLEEVEAFDEEHTSTYFTPDLRYRSR